MIKGKFILFKRYVKNPISENGSRKMNSHIHQLRGMLESSNDNEDNQQQRYQQQSTNSHGHHHDGKFVLSFFVFKI